MAFKCAVCYSIHLSNFLLQNRTSFAHLEFFIEKNEQQEFRFVIRNWIKDTVTNRAFERHLNYSPRCAQFTLKTSNRRTILNKWSCSLVRARFNKHTLQIFLLVKFFAKLIQSSIFKKYEYSSRTTHTQWIPSTFLKNDEFLPSFLTRSSITTTRSSKNSSFFTNVLGIHCVCVVLDEYSYFLKMELWINFAKNFTSKKIWRVCLLNRARTKLQLHLFRIVRLFDVFKKKLDVLIQMLNQIWI